MTSVQPRYAQFARVRGFEPGSDQAPHMHEYISWVRQKWVLWAGLTGRKNLYGLTKEDHSAFDAWLKQEQE